MINRRCRGRSSAQRGVKIGLHRVDEFIGSAAVPGVVTPRPVRDGGPAKAAGTFLRGEGPRG
jgi:hypothetical protein